MTLPAAVGRAFYGHRSTLRSAQELAISPALAGHDVLVIAGTGSGKTEAVVAPIVARYWKYALDHPGVTILYISPTKALANDMASRLEGPLGQLHLEIGRRHGDRNDLNRKTAPHILITTPESFDIELVRQHPAYRAVKAVIVDELHQVVGTQRGLQLCLLMSRLERWLGRRLQVAGMSATLSDPQEAWASLRPGTPCHVVEVVSERARSFVIRREKTKEAVVSLLDRTSSHGKVLAFSGSRGEAEDLAARVGSDGSFKHRVYVHHSSLATDVREQVERDLKGRDATLCIATSTLELGIDIGDINLVVLLGAPADWRSFEQRIGRTNRRGERTNVLGIVPPGTRLPAFEATYFLGLVGQVERIFRRSEPQGRLIGALMQQAVSAVRAARDWVAIRDLLEILTEAPDVSYSDAEEIISALIESEYLRRHPIRAMVGADRNLHQAEERGDAWANFPASSQVLQLFESNRRIGEVPALPANIQLLRPGNIVAFRGRPLCVGRVVRGREIHLRPASGKPQGKLMYGGDSPPRDPVLISQFPDVLRWGNAKQHLASNMVEWWATAAEHLAGGLDGSHVTIWRSLAGIGNATFAGLWINRVIAAAVPDALSAGEITVRSSDPIEFRKLPPFSEVESLAAACNPQKSALTTWQQLLPPELASRELLSPWIRDPFYRNTWEQLRRMKSIMVHDDRLDAFG